MNQAGISGAMCEPFSYYQHSLTLMHGKEAAENEKETNRESLIEVTVPRSSVGVQGRSQRARVGAGRATLRLGELLGRPRPSGPPAYLGDRPSDERRPFRKQAAPVFKVGGWPAMS